MCRSAVGSDLVEELYIIMIKIRFLPLTDDAMVGQSEGDTVTACRRGEMGFGALAS